MMLLAATLTAAAPAPTEREIARAFCTSRGGVAEYVLPDRTRVDCLTELHAWEVERSARVLEAIGQAAHYAAVTGRLPGVAVIVDCSPLSEVHVARLIAVLRTLDSARPWAVVRIEWGWEC